MVGGFINKPENYNKGLPNQGLGLPESLISIILRI
jgi:hypothetical protein